MGVRQEVQSRPAMVVRGIGGGDLSVMPSYMIETSHLVILYCGDHPPAGDSEAVSSIIEVSRFASSGSTALRAQPFRRESSAADGGAGALCEEILPLRSTLWQPAVAELQRIGVVGC
nr:hypothetical protein Iba_chr07aCG1990 [Ipomoea batatas]GMD20205.1 hypothetical protein Iba_chr07fCG2640 [Ipomoea batatas]